MGQTSQRLCFAETLWIEAFDNRLLCFFAEVREGQIRAVRHASLFAEVGEGQIRAVCHASLFAEVREGQIWAVCHASLLPRLGKGRFGLYATLPFLPRLGKGRFGLLLLDTVALAKLGTNRTAEKAATNSNFMVRALPRVSGTRGVSPKYYEP